MFLFFLSIIFSCFRDRNNNADPVSPNYIPQISHVEIDEIDKNRAIVFSERGIARWTIIFDAKIEKCVISDLDNDGVNEVLFGLGEGDLDAGFVYILNWNKEILCKYPPPGENIYPGHKSRNLYLVRDLIVERLEKSKNQRILITWHEIKFYAAKLAMFEPLINKEISYYWNPGYIEKIKVQDLNNDGLKEIVLICINNDLRNIQGFGDGSDNNFKCIAVLPSNFKSGQAPPYLGTNQAGNGSELWYLVVFPQGNSFQFRFVDFYPDSVNPGIELELIVNGGVIWYLSGNGEPIAIGLADNPEANFWKKHYLKRIKGYEIMTYQIKSPDSQEIFNFQKENGPLYKIIYRY